MRRIKRRGDDIPPISDYAHWNEDALYMWWEENKYDMYHSDEIIEDDWDGPDDFEPDGQEKEFLLRSSAEKFMSQHNNANLHHYGSKWVVEYWD